MLKARFGTCCGTVVEVPEIIDLIGATKDTIERCVMMGTIVFWNVPLPKDGSLMPVVGYTYDRERFAGPDLMVMMQGLQQSGGTGRFALILPTGHRMVDWMKNVKTAFSDDLVYQDGVHGDAILMIENHPEAHEAGHIAVAKGFRIV